MSIVRTVHNKENPYVMINKSALWDKNLSLEAVGLWTRLLSRPDDWSIKVAELVKSCGVSVKKCYRILKELIDAGYAYRHQSNGPGGFKSWETYVFEYKVSPEDIQKMFTLGHFALAPNALSANRHTTNTDLTNPSSLRSEERDKRKEAPPPPSAEASALCKLFLEKVRERLPEFKTPDLKGWESDMQKLLEGTTKGPEHIRDLILWAHEHSFWKANCLNPKALRKHYYTMTMQMVSDLQQRNSEANRHYCIEAKKKFPDRLKDLTISPRYAANLKTGKEIPFDLPKDSFKTTFLHVFGGGGTKT